MLCKYFTFLIALLYQRNCFLLWVCTWLTSTHFTSQPNLRTWVTLTISDNIAFLGNFACYCITHCYRIVAMGYLLIPTKIHNHFHASLLPTFKWVCNGMLLLVCVFICVTVYMFLLHGTSMIPPCPRQIWWYICEGLTMHFFIWYLAVVLQGGLALMTLLLCFLKTKALVV